MKGERREGRGERRVRGEKGGARSEKVDVGVGVGVGADIVLRGSIFLSFGWVWVQHTHPGC